MTARLAFLASVVLHLTLFFLFRERGESKTVHLGRGAVLSPVTIERFGVHEKKTPVQRRPAPRKTSEGEEPVSAPGQPGEKSAETILTLGELSSSGNEMPRYPSLAEKNGWEGEVKIRVTFKEPVNDVELLQKSRYTILDDEAVRVAKRWRMPKNETRSVIVPVQFQMK